MFLRLTPLLTLLASSVTGGCMTSDDARATTASGGMLADRAGSSLAERAVSRLIVGNRESRRRLAPSVQLSLDVTRCATFDLERLRRPTFGEHPRQKRRLRQRPVPDVASHAILAASGRFRASWRNTCAASMC